MGLDAAYVGRGFSAPRPYEVGAEKIREFAAAIGDPVPDGAAGASGSSAPLAAPPTFAIVVIAGAQATLIREPGLGLDFSRVVHGDQGFVHHRPIVAGDVLSSTMYIDSVRTLAGNEVLGLRTEITDTAGQPVCTATGTLVVRKADPSEADASIAGEPRGQS